MQHDMSKIQCREKTAQRKQLDGRQGCRALVVTRQPDHQAHGRPRTTYRHTDSNSQIATNANLPRPQLIALPKKNSSLPKTSAKHCSRRGSPYRRPNPVFLAGDAELPFRQVSSVGLQARGDSGVSTETP
jgi:hypothetical protein